MATPLQDWIVNLLSDRDARDAFDRDPRGYAEDHGFHDLSGGDVHDALSLLADGDYSDNDYRYPSPHEWNHNDHDSGSSYLRSYIHENNHSWERSDTDIDNSVHQRIDTGGDRGDRDDWDRDRDRDWSRDRNDDDNRDHDSRDHDNWGRGDGGDFHQVIDNDPVVASGHGSVAAGGDIRDSTITSGNGNVIGHDNQAVTGDHNTTAFGSGDATSADLGDTRIGDGGAVSIGGNAYGHNEDNDTSTRVHSSGDGSTAVNVAGADGDANQSTDQSYHDDSSYSHYENNSDTDSHDDYNSHNSSDYDDSHDVDVHH
jgi:hypothetical protein